MDIAKVLACLLDRGFIPFYADNKDEAVKTVLKLIPAEASVGFGGSMTAEALNLPAVLKERGNKVLQRTVMPEFSREELYLKSRDADYYIASANALSEDGQIVNIDGRGNRVASMIYGPKNVVLVVGINKITPDLEKALWRAKNVAAPLNAKRFNLSTPCIAAGKCMDCRSIERLCRATLILSNPTYGKNFNIIIINENLGF